MSEETSNTGGGESFAELFEQSVRKLQEGEVVKGNILSIDADQVQVDVGFKSEGFIDTWEFMDEGGNILVEVGDEVDVLIEEAEDDEGRIVLSKEKADRLKIWDEISGAYEADQPVEGKVLSRVKGGLSVDIGVKAFLPGSQVDLRPVRNLENLLGERLDFKIIKFNKRRGNIVLSRRALLEKEREKMRASTLETLEEGQIVDGVIKNITDYGAFIDLGGIDGLLHVTDQGPSAEVRCGDGAGLAGSQADPAGSLGGRRHALPDRRTRPGTGGFTHRLRRVRRAGNRHRRTRSRFGDVLDQADQAPVQDGRHQRRGRGGDPLRR
jgi:DNA-directed RNA polymerase subunit E'/Rpb7